MLRPLKQLKILYHERPYLFFLTFCFEQTVCTFVNTRLYYTLRSKVMTRLKHFVILIIFCTSGIATANFDPNVMLESINTFLIRQMEVFDPVIMCN